MTKLHDDLLARADSLLDRAKKTAALETEQQQGMTDVLNKLDEAYKVLDQLLKDNAAEGSSTGGGSGAQGSPQQAAMEQAWRARPQQGAQAGSGALNTAGDAAVRPGPASQQGWKP